MWGAWLTLYPYMVMKYIEFKPFSSFKNDLLSQTVKHTNISNEEIEKEIMGVVAAYEGQLKQKE